MLHIFRVLVMTTVIVDPVAKSTSWTPSASFSRFLDTYFRRKLSYQQSLNIQSYSSSESSPSSKAWSAVAELSSFRSEKVCPRKDKEMFVIQRAFLNSPGLLCGLYDCLETGSNPTYEEIKLALEQTLCLVGSANMQVTVLKRQRILPSINRSRNNLAELPLTSAKTWLFGASKQA